MSATQPAGAAAKPFNGPGRPNRYKLASGKVVPSVTTILERFADASGLIIWANREGLAGRDMNQARDQAANDGDVAHQWIQDVIHGRELTDYPYADEATLARAANALKAFKAWAAEVDLRVVATEVPLVSEDLAFGGTLDAIAWVQGVLCLLDWKSGNRCYPEHVVQQAAYRRLLREQTAARFGVPVPEGAVLLRTDKETGEPHARILPPEALDLGEEYFLLCRKLYELDKDVSKLVAKPKGKAA